jgi:site-specific recombinase XerD
MNSQITVPSTLSPALVTAVQSWADATTDATSKRRSDLLRDKALVLIGDGLQRRKGALVYDESGKPKQSAMGFFAYRPMPLNLVTAADVRDWQTHLETRLSAASVYSYISRLSSFYQWLLTEPTFKEQIKGNPVDLARPKAPKPYQSERVNSLTDKQAHMLYATIKADADAGDVAAKRDYALLRLFFATGKRRSEIINLVWGNLTIEGDTFSFSTRHKGGVYKGTEVKDTEVLDALYDYLKASGRWNGEYDTPDMQPESPLWLRHDNAAQPGQAMTAQGFVKALKAYARRAGIGDVHLHQTRHTVARWVGEESGDLADVQTVLGHTNQATTRIYLERVAVKRDKFSEKIGQRLKGG